MINDARSHQRERMKNFNFKLLWEILLRKNVPGLCKRGWLLKNHFLKAFLEGEDLKMKTLPSSPPTEDDDASQSSQPVKRERHNSVWSVSL